MQLLIISISFKMWAQSSTNCLSNTFIATVVDDEFLDARSDLKLHFPPCSICSLLNSSAVQTVPNLINKIKNEKNLKINKINKK